jgi:AcrR family transcriptional regulator
VEAEGRQTVACKDQIADVFEKHVERFGYQKTTLDEVARELRISKKTLYAFFDGKADIYRYVVERIARQSRSQLAAAVAGMPTFGEKLTGVVRLAIGTARAHVEETSAGEWRAQFEVADDAFREAMGSLLAELVAGGVEAAVFPAQDVGLTVRMVGAMLVEYALMLRDDPGYDRDEELTAAIRRFIG